MTQDDMKRIAEAIVSVTGVQGFALVLGIGDQTIVLLNNCCATAAGEMLLTAGRDISDGEQRPALFH